MDTDLQQANRANILEEVHKRYIVYQMLSSMAIMHSANLVHGFLHTDTFELNS